MQKADFAEHSTGQVTSQRSVAYALSLVVNHLAGYYFCFRNHYTGGPDSHQRPSPLAGG
jgi:hypothetical protein